ncbi:MAG: MBL fold metallo-hydrolase [bacterium]
MAINKKYQLIFFSVIVLILSIAIVIIFHNIKTNDSDIIKNIEVEKVTTRIMLVKYGYDAVYSIETKEGLVVIDAGISNSLTSYYRKIIERELKRDDFIYLINTHSHWDHTGGNQVFADAVIIAHENCTSEMTEYWKDKEKIKNGVKKIITDYEKQLKNIDTELQDSLEIYLQKIRYRHVYDDLLNDRIVTVPNKTFNDTMNISLGDMTLNLIYFGKAHSGSDIMIYIPEEKVLMVGDLFSKYGRPSIEKININDIERWMIAKRWLDERLENIDIVINGHGEIMERNDLESFNEFIEKKWKARK